MMRESECSVEVEQIMLTPVMSIHSMVSPSRNDLDVEAMSPVRPCGSTSSSGNGMGEMRGMSRLHRPLG